MKFTAVGDALIQQPYEVGYEGFAPIKEFIMRGDVRFVNLETTLNKPEDVYGNQYSGGSYLRTDPKSLDTTLDYGFNMLSFNNNHALDFGFEGLLSTLDILDATGIPHTGVGRDLREASRPVYLETENGKVAMISVCSSFSAPMIAGNASPAFKGRPGINGLRVKMHLVVTPEQLKAVQEIGEQSGVNARHIINRKDGYTPELPDGMAEIDTIKFRVGEKADTIYEIDARDIARVKATIAEAKKNADYVFVSLHTHQITGGHKENVPAFLSDFSHMCIDEGAHAVIGHGPHLIRGVEIYKDCPIFHSLGDFILQLNSIPCAPADFYENYGLVGDEGMEKLLDTRSEGGKKGLMYDRKMMETFVPFWEMEDGKLTRLELLPVDLGYDLEVKHPLRGVPVATDDMSCMERLKSLSAELGTKMHFEDGKVVVDL